ncbi:MAG: hypothetical protein K6C32_01320 [Bacilli bacterium]|nr:hypothetical protein [Bacilli bacterium]
MKKVSELIKPFICVILGALLLLFYLNWLSGQGATLGIGITAVILSVYYLTVGVLGVVLGDKMDKTAKRILDLVSVSLFPLFLFALILISVVAIQTAEEEEIRLMMGPTGWVIAILSMVGSLTFVGFFIVASLVNVKWLQRLCLLFASVFVLVLATNVLFDVYGNPILLGSINLIQIAIYACYTYMMFNVLLKPQKAKEE